MGGTPPHTPWQRGLRPLCTHPPEPPQARPVFIQMRKPRHRLPGRETRARALCYNRGAVL